MFYCLYNSFSLHDRSFFFTATDYYFVDSICINQNLCLEADNGELVRLCSLAVWLLCIKLLFL